MDSLSPRETPYHIAVGNAALCITAKSAAKCSDGSKATEAIEAGQRRMSALLPKATVSNQAANLSLSANSDNMHRSKSSRYSITSSARPSSGNEIVKPSERAVLRLSTNSIFVDCTTGRSAGFSPLRIRPV